MRIAPSLLLLGALGLPGIAHALPAPPLLPERLLVAQTDATPTPSPTATPEDDRNLRPPERPKYFPPLFWYEHSEERQSTFRMFLMLWWSADNPDRDYQLLLPFFYHRLDKASDANTWAGPFFYWWSSPLGRALYVPPVYWEDSKSVKRRGVPPLFWYGKVGGETTSYLVPFYFYDNRDGRRVLATPIGGGWGSKNDFQGIIGPWYWRNAHDPDAGTDLDAYVLFPVFWSLHDHAIRTKVAGPFFRQTRDAAHGQKQAFGVFPFFYRRTSPGGGSTTVTPLSVFERHDKDRAFLVTPLGGYASAPGRSLLVVGPWIDQRAPEQRFQALFPLYFHGASEPPGGGSHRSWTVIGTYIESRQTARWSDGATTSSLERGLLPLFWYSNHDRDVHFTSPGVIFHRHPGGELTGLFGPLWLTKSKASATYVLLPGLWYHRSESLPVAFGAVPFWYARWKTGETSTGLFPIAYLHNRIDERTKKRDRTAYLLPLLWYSEHPGRMVLLTPLYAQIRSPYHERRVMAAWLWWDHRGVDHRDTTLIPFFHYSRLQDHRELYTPVGGYVAGNGYLRSLWGPVYHRREDELKIRQDVVFPFFWRFDAPESHTLVAGPYFRVKQGGYFSEGFVPLWFHSSFPGAAQTVVFPFFMVRVDKVEKTRTLVTPLGGLWTRKDPAAYKLLAPLVFQARGPGERTTVFFPLFWYDYRHGRQLLVIPPFFDRYDKEKRTLTTGVFPLFQYHREPGSTFLLSPGLFYSRTDDRRATAILPLAYVWKRSAQRSAGMAGLWFWSKSRVDEHDRFRMLFPLFLEREKGKNLIFASPLLVHSRWGLRTVTVVPGFGWATRYGEDGKLKSAATLLGPLYVRVAPERSRDVVLFPIFWHTRSPLHAATAIPPLFYYERTGTRWSFLTVAAGGANDAVTGNYWWWALNTIHSHKGDTDRTAVLPLLYLQSSPRETSVLTPLFWHDRNLVTQTTTTVAPFFFRRATPTRKTTVIFPLAWWDADPQAGLVNAGLMPIAFYHRDPMKSTVAIPLLFTFYQRRGEDHVGVFGPVADVKLGDKRTVFLFPIFRYHSEPDYASFASLPFIWWLRHGKDTRAFVGLGYWNTETGTRVFPGYVRLQGHDDSGRVVRSAEIGLPIFVRYTTTKKRVTVIAPWYSVEHFQDHSRVHGVAPFWSESFQPGSHGWSVFGDLIGYDRVGRHRWFRYLWVFDHQLKDLPAARGQVTLRKLALVLDVPPADAVGSGDEVPDRELAVAPTGDQEAPVGPEGE